MIHLGTVIEKMPGPRSRCLRAGQRGESRLLGLARILRGVFLCFLRAVVAADGDFLAADHYLDSAIVYIPIAHGALFRIHKLSPLKMYRRLSTCGNLG